MLCSILGLAEHRRHFLNSGPRPLLRGGLLGGWYVVGVVSCLSLLAIAFEDRRAIRSAVQGRATRLADRAFAW